MASVTAFGIDHRYIVIPAMALSVGVACYSSYKLYSERNDRRHQNVYETKKLLSEYLVFHYGQPNEILKYDFGPKDALDFPKRCADLCLKHYKPKAGVPARAFDIGCAVGRSSFELARIFDDVVGLDYSQRFVDTCNQLKLDGLINYSIYDEGEITTDLTARVDKTIHRDRTRFIQGDACCLPADLGQFGVVLAANLICRLHHPFDFLWRMGDLVAPGGILVITSPYTWLAEYTERENLLGGYYNKDGQPVTGFMTLLKSLGPFFDLVDDINMPFFIRETARKNQWTVAHATVWKRKSN
ncbi:hypothetical protein LOTGIDRAFT_236265 [Lottia gigantea]|uniref:Methyltransferase type 11 domain-containing protein n=1 Tax=Lottia gigantea TaxID=225164 RepID=V3Z1Q7_LOTGI|nr:hypothetical protein LOTGIDRAFT_236265 [Lottia gigantea]ESO84473.1 hypothetical protein LOTGIDRAFT_236265 [Lottia gigantea]